jgi:hypothetical protein
MNTDVLFIFFFCLLGVGGVLLLLGFFFTDEKCKGCGDWGEAEYMLLDTEGDYWHFSCYANEHNTKYGYTKPTE